MKHYPMVSFTKTKNKRLLAVVDFLVGTLATIAMAAVFGYLLVIGFYA